MQRYAVLMAEPVDDLDGHGPDPAGDRQAPGPTLAVGGWAGYRRDPDGRWRRAVDGVEVTGAGDVTLGELFDPPLGEHDGAPVRLVPRAWASRHPDHPLAWAFEHADLGG